MQRVLLAGVVAASLAGCGDEETDPGASTTEPAAEASPLRERLDRLVTRLLTDRGLDPALTECALGELAEAVPDSELEAAISQIRKTGAPPPSVTEAAAAAGEACGRP